MNEERTNSLAVFSFVMTMLFFIPLTGVVGFITGMVALYQINRNGEKGRGLAITSITLGAIGTTFWLLFAIGAA